MGDDDPIRERMARLSDGELRAVVGDIDSWSNEARVAAFEELCRRGVTDVPDPRTTSTSIQREAHRGDRDGGRGSFYVGAAIVLGILSWLLHIVLH